jgi:hypothetical protein
MNGLAELLVANGGTLLTFAIFIGERIIQATKDRTSAKQRIDDKTVHAYLEWLRRQDHALLLRTIEERHDELVAYLVGDASKLKEIIEITLQLLNSDFIDLKAKVAALDKAIQRPVLSSIPINYRDLADVPLLSRDDELAMLRQINGDLIISGQPGSGKTFLLYHLSKEWSAKFLVSHDEGDIFSYLRFSSPPVIIVDDAYDWLEILSRLIHFRMETGKSFRIIAVCWPFEEPDLTSIMRLSSKSIYRLSLLPAKAIVQLIKSRFEAAGYDNIATWLIREIREQAAGRPGLALRLVDLLLEDGSLKALKEGQAHFELIDRAFRHIEGVDTRLTLAAFAVGGKTGMRKGDVSSVLGIPVHQTTKVLRALATGGVIKEICKETLATIPDAFRHVLMKDVFLRGDALALDEQFWKLYESAPNKETALMGLIGAMANGAIVDENRLLAELQDIDSIKTWGRLAWVGPGWCEKVINEHPGAIESLADPPLHHIPERAIPLLLTLAIGDKRPENAHPEAPIRKLGDWVTHFSLHAQDAVKRRQLLLATTLLWLRQGGNELVAWKILPKCVSFQYENSETDPGDGKAVTLTFGLVSLSDLKEIAELWVPIVEYAKEFPPSDWEALKAVLNDWLHPYVPNVVPPDGFDELARAKAIEVIQQLIIQPDLPKNALIRWAIEHEIGTDIVADSEFLAFCPPDRIRASGDWRVAEKKYGEDATALGKKWATQAPESVAEKLVLFEKERRLFGINWPLLGHAVCYSIANHVSNLAAWVETFMKYDVEADYLFPLVRQAIVKKDPQTYKWLSLALSMKSYRWHAISEILANGELPKELFLQAWPFLGEYSKGIGVMALRGDIASGRLEALSEHDNKELLLEVAIGDFHSDKQPLLRNNRAIWLKMFRKAIMGMKELNTHYFYDIEKLLESVPEIRFDLAAALLTETKYISWVHDEPYRKLFALMGVDEKIRLLPLLEGIYPTDFTAWLIGDDLSIYRALLKNEKLRSHHLLPLKGKPSELLWQGKALLALDYGYQPRDVARAAFGNHWEWSGSAVAFWQGWIDEYNILLNSSDPRLQEVGRIGKELPEYERGKSRKEEEHEAIYGISGDE